MIPNIIKKRKICYSINTKNQFLINNIPLYEIVSKIPLTNKRRNLIKDACPCCSEFDNKVYWKTVNCKKDFIKNKIKLRKFGINEEGCPVCCNCDNCIDRVKDYVSNNQLIFDDEMFYF